MFLALLNCFENLKMMVTQDYGLFLLLLIFGLWQFQQGQGAYLAENENYEINSTEADVKIALYCEIKSTQKQTRHFHKKTCIKRNSDFYTKNCERPSHKKSKRCLRFSKKLEKVIKGKSDPQAKSLFRKDYKRVCGNIKAGRYLKLYNTSEYICCMGKIYRRRNKDWEHACCGDSVVDKPIKICCDGRTYVRASVEEMCCGQQVYNTSTHFCHLNHIYDRSEDSNVTFPHRPNDSSELEYNITDPSTNFEARSEGDDQTSNDETSHHGTLLISVLGVISSLTFVLFFGLVVYKHQRGMCTLKRKADTSSDDRQIVSSSESMPSGNIQPDIFCTNSPSVNRGQISNQSCLSLGQNTVTTNSSPTANEADGSIVVRHSHRTTNKENYRSRRRSGESLHSHVSLKLEDFIKDSKVRGENFTTNLIKDSSTQTCPPKETNLRDIFGKTFQYSGCLTKKNPSIKLKHSDAKMTLSSKDLSQHDIEVNASSHTDIPEIKQKMGIRDGYQITSPCMEYDLPGIDKLDNFAVIEMKLVQRKNDKIQVWRMTTGEDGGQTFEVPVVQSFQPHLDTFCLIINAKAFIYTKIFSTYVCTRHNNIDTEIDLWGLLYAKMTCSPIRAVLTLYVVERLHVEVEDYKTKLDIEEEMYGMSRIDRNRVPLPDTVTDRDQIIVRLSIDDRESWDFIRDPRNPDEEYDAYKLSLCDICCQRRSVETSRCKWQMENINLQEPNIFRGHFYVKTGPDEREKRVFTVDEAVTRVQYRYSSHNPVRAELSKSPVCSVDQWPVVHGELPSLMDKCGIHALSPENERQADWGDKQKQAERLICKETV